MSLELENQKERNIELYEQKERFEELAMTNKSISRCTNEGEGQQYTDEEHIKEMLGTQNLLREEMKEKEFFKDKYQRLMEETIKMEDELLKKGTEVDKEKDVMNTNLKLVEAKNQEIHDKLLAS